LPVTIAKGGVKLHTVPAKCIPPPTSCVFFMPLLLRALALLCISVFALSANAVALADQAFDKDLRPFFKQHCQSCHGATKQESRLRLDQVTGVQAGNRNLWTIVYERVAAGEMPPKDHDQPTDAERKRVLTWIAEQQRALGASGSRRLNRREMSGALKDVTGLAVDFSLGLPGDGTVGGFDTGADGLQEASDAVSTWLLVTRRAVDGIRFLESPKSKPIVIDFAAVKDLRKDLDSRKDEGVIIRYPGGPQLLRSGKGALLEPQSVGDRDSFSITVPAPASRQGVLRLTLVVSTMRPYEKIPNSHLWVEVGGKNLDYREIVAPFEKPIRLTYDVQIGDLVVTNKGVTVHFTNKVETPYAVDGFENEQRENPKDPIPGGPGLYRPKFDRRALPPEKQPAPYLLFHKIEIEPEMSLAWPPSEWKAEVRDIADNLDSAKRLLKIWMDRAWRRPTTDGERTPFVKLYEKARGAGESFDNGLRAAFQSVFMSPPFRYMASPSDTDPANAQYALASRLSFMLTGAPPDAELRRLAAEGKLRDPAVLDAQTDRLLADPQSEAFFRPFVMQWLVLDQPITIAQSHINKQDFRFARHLKASMREETIAYITQMVAENRPAKELLLSDWTMMNDALALHYGYPSIESGELRKVKLRPEDPRGGILGHAGIQSMLCWMGENWVIYRGAWALRHILDMPPPPPPLEVPELNPSDGKNKGKSSRELLKQHQEDRRCTVCHKHMDPVGFAFQNFDISGRWRDVEHAHYVRKELDGRVAWYGAGDTRPVDAAGNLPRGEPFKNFREFKQILAKEYQTDLVRGLLKSLMIYAVGRVPGIDERAEIAAIMKETRGKEHPLRDLIKAAVRSRAFLEINEPIQAQRRP